MSTIPDLPVVDEDASMLSVKFGRELANYFAGSPLNRVGFLRGDHAFLRSAFSHPSARFLLLHELAPLVDETQKSLGYVSYADVKGFTGPDPFEKTEEDMIKSFNSEDEEPLILLLGLDEANRLRAPKTEDLFAYKEWKGRPYFAVDVSPRGKLSESASEVINAVKDKGFSFFQNQRHMGLAYGEGELFTTSFPVEATCYLLTMNLSCSGRICASPLAVRLEYAKSLLRSVRIQDAVCQRGHQEDVPPNRYGGRGAQRTHPVRVTTGYLQHMLPEDRPHHHRGSGVGGWDQDPTGQEQAVPAALVQHACWVPRAGRVDRRGGAA